MIYLNDSVNIIHKIVYDSKLSIFIEFNPFFKKWVGEQKNKIQLCLKISVKVAMKSVYQHQNLG